MRVLIIKTSSLGDVIHTFPALTDAVRAIPGIQFDWVVEEAFQEIPAWHPAVQQVIPSAMRRWRRSWLGTWLSGEWKTFVQRLRAQQYDAVIDAQGLIKSALITRKARGEKFGLDAGSAREPLASRFYDRRLPIERQQHAIERTRQLFARSLGYTLDELPLEYGLEVARDEAIPQDTLMFLPGTTWSSKRWPMDFWSTLIDRTVAEGHPVLLPAGNDEETRQANLLAAGRDPIKVMANQSISRVAAAISSVRAVVAVDTGLAHMAAALDTPAVALYGATDARLTGIRGKHAISLQAAIDCSPCFHRDCPKVGAAEAPPCTATLDAGQVWQALQEML